MKTCNRINKNFMRFLECREYNKMVNKLIDRFYKENGFYYSGNIFDYYKVDVKKLEENIRKNIERI